MFRPNFPRPSSEGHRLKRIRIGYYYNRPEDAISFYRVVGPLQGLAKEHPEIEIIPVHKISWDELGAMDICLVKTPFSDKDLDFVRELNILNVRVWTDYDDDVLAIPEANPAFGPYSHPNTPKNVLESMYRSDVVTFSTAALLDKYKNQFDIRKQAGKIDSTPNMEIIPNAFNDYFLRREVKTDRPKIILWRGGPSHAADLESVREDVFRIAEEFPHYFWNFMGERCPWSFKRHAFSQKVVDLPGISPVKYFLYIQNMAPEIVWHPLEDNEFNRSKSNNAWMEASFAGALTVAPDLPEWGKPGVFTYKQGKFYEAMKSAILYKEKAELADKAWGYICSNLLLRNVNRARWNIIQKLCG